MQTDWQLHVQIYYSFFLLQITNVLVALFSLKKKIIVLIMVLIPVLANWIQFDLYIFIFFSCFLCVNQKRTFDIFYSKFTFFFRRMKEQTLKANTIYYYSYLSCNFMPIASLWIFTIFELFQTRIWRKCIYFVAVFFLFSITLILGFFLLYNV